MRLLQNPEIKLHIKDYSEIPYLVTSEYGLCLTSTVSLSPPDSYAFLWYLQSNFKRNISVSKHYSVRRGSGRIVFSIQFWSKACVHCLVFRQKKQNRRWIPIIWARGGSKSYRLKPTAIGLYGKLFSGKVSDLIDLFSHTAAMLLFKYKEIHTCDCYAPSTVLVFTDKMKFTFLPMSLSLDITSGSLETLWKFSI